MLLFALLPEDYGLESLICNMVGIGSLRKEVTVDVLGLIWCNTVADRKLRLTLMVGPEALWGCCEGVAVHSNGQIP